MLDIKFIREHPEQIKKGAEAKRIACDLDHLLALDQEIKPQQQKWETLQADRNRLSKTIGKAPAEEREALKAQVSDIKQEMDQLTAKLREKRAAFDQLMLLVPQPARDDVPIGKDDGDNVEIKTWGQRPTFAFTHRDHVEIGDLWGGLDIARGVKLAGSRSYLLLGDLARLEQAILRFTYDLLCKRGYLPVSIPVLVNEDAMEGTGYFPVGRDQAYCVEKDQLALVGTAEVALTSIRRDEILNEAELPLRFMAWSSCFRREAGTYGKDTHGLYRVHQFQKIEQVIIGPNSPEDSERFHQELLQNAEDVLQALELPYRVVYVCTGDLGQGQLRKHDIETWMPSRNAYCETHSCSTFHEFQSRRLKLRYKTKDGKKLFCHTLNNTAVASPRVLIPLIECHQQQDGSVRIPEKLRPYLDGQPVLGPASP